MGQGLSQLTEEQVKQLKENTPFDEKDLVRLLKRYAQFDSSEKGDQGAALSDLLTMPEFSVSPMMPRVLQLYSEPESNRVFPESFLYLCAALSSKNTVANKRNLAFRCFDRHESGYLEHDEVFHLYKIIYNESLTDTQIMLLTDRALSDPSLANQAVITQQEFNQMVTDWEIKDRFTIDLQGN